jgi:hypothetical protein
LAIAAVVVIVVAEAIVVLAEDAAFLSEDQDDEAILANGFVSSLLAAFDSGMSIFSFSLLI